MERWVNPPAELVEVIFGYPWPIWWAYLILGLLTVFGLVIARWRNLERPWIIWAALGWWLWQIVSATQSVDDNLSTATVKHFTGCLICFYLGFFALSRTRRLWIFWAGIFCGLLLVLLTALEQHFGGLKASREYFFTNVYPTLKEVPPGYLKKISSDRIFGTLFYPNALAGALLLLLPPTVALLWQTERFTKAARTFLILVVAVGSLACLFWSGSKGGWLLMMALGILALLRVPMPNKYKAGIIGLVLVAGLTTFAVRHFLFFQRGATSVSARFDYWQAALKTTEAHPIFGTGPGTFFIPYQQIKRPESEPSRLVHNDYLEQASDSGIPGLLLYAAFIFGAMTFSARRTDFRTNDVVFALWLGVLGWSLQSLVEFSLYIPSLAWPALTLLGWLVAGVPGRTLKQVENRQPAA
jgi:O-antigen ligase